VAEVRAGLGVLAAVELAPDLLAEDPGAPGRLHRYLLEEGVIVRSLAKGMAVSPPLVADEAELDLLAEAVPRALDRLTTG
jgi:adenosylmethionine-8-amino-7-oxononanoate aminotransferase